MAETVAVAGMYKLLRSKHHKTMGGAPDFGEFSEHDIRQYASKVASRVVLAEGVMQARLQNRLDRWTPWAHDPGRHKRGTRRRLVHNC
jgi:hypothetical protein